MIAPQRALLVATMCLPSPPMRLGSGVNTRPSLYSLSLHVRVSSLAARFVQSCYCLDGNSSGNKLCVDVVNYLNFLDRSFEKGESDKRGINIAWRRPWSVVCSLGCILLLRHTGHTSRLGVASLRASAVTRKILIKLRRSRESLFCSRAKLIFRGAKTR